MSMIAETDDKSHGFWRAVGADVYDALSETQRKSVFRAARWNSGDHIRSDVRLSFGRYFLVLLFGKERRSRERLAEERVKRPVFVAKNLPLILFLWGSILYTLYSLVGLALYGFARLLS